MDNNKSANKKKTNRYYIKIIDDTLTDEYQKWQKANNRAGSIVLYYFMACIAAGIAVLFGGIFQSFAFGCVVFVIALIIFIYLIANDKKRAVAKPEPIREKTKQPIEKEKLEDLKDLLERVGYISLSHCNGFVMTPSQTAKTQFVPLYGIATNPPVEKKTFIRTNSDLKFFSRKDKALIQEVFGLKKDDDVIWFSQKNVVKWTALSNMPVINYVDKDGNKKCFGHTKYSVFYNHRELTIEDGECVIHIKDKRPNYEKTASDGEDETDGEYESEDEYYDDDI